MLDYIIAPISVFLALISLSTLRCNWSIFLGYFWKRKWHSSVPLLGQIAGAIACLIYPFYDLKAYWWVPVVLDIPSFILIFHIIRLSLDKENR